MRKANGRWMIVTAFFAALIGVASSTEAGVVDFTSSAGFETAIAGDNVSREFYSTLAAGTLIGAGQTVDGLTYTSFTGRDLLGGIVTNQFNSFSGNSLGGDQSTGAQFFFGGDSLTITFAAPVNAVGLFFNVNLNSGNFGLTTSVGSVSTPSTAYDTSTFVFAGLVSTDARFSSVTIFSTDSSLGSYNIPEIITASTVPEPSTLLLSVSGLMIAGYRSLRRRGPIAI